MVMSGATSPPALAAQAASTAILLPKCRVFHCSLSFSASFTPLTLVFRSVDESTTGAVACACALCDTSTLPRPAAGGSSGPTAIVVLSQRSRLPHWCTRVESVSVFPSCSSSLSTRGNNSPARRSLVTICQRRKTRYDGGVAHGNSRLFDARHRRKKREFPVVTSLTRSREVHASMLTSQSVYMYFRIYTASSLFLSAGASSILLRSFTSTRDKAWLIHSALGRRSDVKSSHSAHRSNLYTHPFSTHSIFTA